MRFSPGTRLGPYEVVAPLGSGGMGEVYRARDTRLDRTVALKVLSPELAADLSFRSRFEREARAISTLNHPHICALHDIGQQDGVDYLVLEHLEGRRSGTSLRPRARGSSSPRHSASPPRSPTPSTRRIAMASSTAI